MGEVSAYSVKRFGREQEPVVIIDDFSPRFKELRQAAGSKSYQRLGPFYPGIRAQADPSYIYERMDVLKDILVNVFDCHKGVDLTECAFSLVTAKPPDLTPIQCMPHYDGTDHGRLAVLHYLSETGMGGTAFYRHRATGYETVTDDRFDTYKTSLEKGVEEQGLPVKAYINKSTVLFELIGRVDARPNHLIIYRGVTLHSGFIPDDVALETDPTKGRLTINTFLSQR